MPALASTAQSIVDVSPDAPASLMCRYCSEGTGRPGAARERFVAHGTVASLASHLFELSDEEFEAHFIATDTIDLHRDNVLALHAAGRLGAA